MDKCLIAFIVLTIFVSLHYTVNARPPLGIINGTTAEEGEFPYMIQLCLTSGDFHCGGSILGPEWILTAGHCVVDIDDAFIVYGAIKICSQNDSRPNTSIEIKNWFQHPNFTYVSDTGIPIYDVGILQLAEPIPFSGNVQPIQIAEANANIPFHVEGVVSGWGLTRFLGSLATYLQKINLPLLTDAECIEKNNEFREGNYSFIPIHNICTDGRNHGVNHGDSGSPYVINGTQYGITSWGFFPGATPGDYSRVSNPDYRGWIKNITGI